MLLDEIKMHRKGIDETLARVNVLWFEHGSSPSKMKEALERKLQKGIKDVDNLKHVLATTAARAFESRKIISPAQPSEDLSCKYMHILTLATDNVFIAFLKNQNSFILQTLFQVIVENSLGHTTRKSSNFRLTSLKKDLMTTMGNALSASNRELLSNFPVDIRSTRDLLGAPQTVTYACCPDCSSIYAPKDEDGVPIYPYKCTSKRCQGGCDLLELGSTPDGESIGVPKRPYEMQDFDDFVARLLSRPGMETAIQQSRERVHGDIVEDIMSADGVQAIKGPDDAPFLSGGQANELRLLWALSVDFFNAHHNKIAGKTYPVGCILLSCIQLPPDMRKKTENLYLVGLIPGPREPSMEEIDHFLRPLVEVMKESWKHGAIYRTHDFPHGRLVRSALALSINDLPMARKIMGTANYIDRNTAKDENVESWKVRSLQTLRDHARRWREARSPKERKQVYNKNGVRYSVLMELEYWDPTTMVPVDCMHLLFLGLSQYHARSVLGMDSAGGRKLSKRKGTGPKRAGKPRKEVPIKSSKV